MRSPVALALDGDLAGAAAAALRNEDPDDRYLDLVLVSVACKRLGDPQAVALTARVAARNYRPIVEEGLYPLYSTYLAEIASILPDLDVAPFVLAMEPEIEGMGTLPPSNDPPARFLSLYTDLLRLASGGTLPLERLQAHQAAHLLLTDLARRAVEDPALDDALLDLGLCAARDAGKLAERAMSSPDLFTRGKLRHALLRIANCERALFDRAPHAAREVLEAVPWPALSALPAGPRLEAIGALVDAIADFPTDTRSALYPLVLEAVGDPAPRTAWLRRQFAPVVAIVGAFADASPEAAQQVLALFEQFRADDGPLHDGAADQAGRSFAGALVRLGQAGLAGLESLYDWCEREAPAALPEVLVAWARAADRSPFELRPRWREDPLGAWAIVRAADEPDRQHWAAQALEIPPWNLPRLALDRTNLEAQRAIAELLVLHPGPLADPQLASSVAAFVRNSAPASALGDANPFARTLDLLGPGPPAYPLAVLFEARLASEGYAAYEHDQALRRVVSWALQDGPNAALKLASGFAARNDASWLLGPLLAEGAAPFLDPDILGRLSLNPFLLGAYHLETRCANCF